MFKVITISREFGSGGSGVAHCLAERLDWRVVDISEVETIARRAEVDPELAERFDECVDPWFHRLLKALWRGGYENVVTRVDAPLFDADALAELWGRIIEESAAIGECVIVGHGGQCVLRGRRDVFHVSLYAPLEEKVARIRKRIPADGDAETCARETDQRRAAYVKRHFSCDWTDRHLYHVIVNTTLGIDRAARVIIAAAGLQHLDKRET
jgi:cytidylate kinase